MEYQLQIKLNLNGWTTIGVFGSLQEAKNYAHAREDLAGQRKKIVEVQEGIVIRDIPLRGDPCVGTDETGKRV